MDKIILIGIDFSLISPAVCIQFPNGEYKFISSIDLLEEMNNALFEILKNYPEQVVNSGLSVDEITAINNLKWA